MMNKVANTLKDNGVKKGDRVVIYMPVSPIAVATMLACARIGAPHSVVFAGFSSAALASRIQDGIQFVYYFCGDTCSLNCDIYEYVCISIFVSNFYVNSMQKILNYPLV